MSFEFKHTFAVLAYKESPYIEECILSLLNQKEQSNIIICTSTPNQYLENLANKHNIPLFINKDDGSVSIIFGMFLVLNQKILDNISLKLGVGRGVDLIFYFVISILVYCLIIFYRKLLKQDEILTKIIRNNAINNAKKI